MAQKVSDQFNLYFWNTIFCALHSAHANGEHIALLVSKEITLLYSCLNEGPSLLVSRVLKQYAALVAVKINRTIA